MSKMINECKRSIYSLFLDFDRLKIKVFLKLKKSQNNSVLRLMKNVDNYNNYHNKFALGSKYD